jgi:hypothetical protein
MRYIRAVGYWICGAASHCGRRRISQEKEKEKPSLDDGSLL